MNKPIYCEYIVTEKDGTCYCALAESSVAALRAEVERLKEAAHLADGTANLALAHRDAAEARIATLRAALTAIVEASAGLPEATDEAEIAVNALRTTEGRA